MCSSGVTTWRGGSDLDVNSFPGCWLYDLEAQLTPSHLSIFTCGMTSVVLLVCVGGVLIQFSFPTRSDICELLRFRCLLMSVIYSNAVILFTGRLTGDRLRN